MIETDCADVRPRLSAYHDNELLPKEVTVVRSHVESCPSCAKELQSFASIGELMSRTRSSAINSNGWSQIEAKLSEDSRAFATPVRTSSSLWKSPYAAMAISTAASTLLLVGLGLLMHESNRDAGLEHGGAMAMQADHGDSHETSSEHLVEFNRVMDDYLQTLDVDPERAERMLNSTYKSTTVDVEHATQLVGYRPIVSDGLPEGYTLASTRVMAMPCCTCLKSVCKRADGSTLVLFEHDDAKAAWFGDRQSTMATCGDKECCLVELDSDIAATWRQGTRSVTAVGVKNQAEVEKLVRWLDQT